MMENKYKTTVKGPNHNSKPKLTTQRSFSHVSEIKTGTAGILLENEKLKVSLDESEEKLRKSCQFGSQLTEMNKKLNSELDERKNEIAQLRSEIGEVKKTKTKLGTMYEEMRKQRNEYQFKATHGEIELEKLKKEIDDQKRYGERMSLKFSRLKDKETVSATSTRRLSVQLDDLNHKFARFRKRRTMSFRVSKKAVLTKNTVSPKKRSSVPVSPTKPAPAPKYRGTVRKSFASHPCSDVELHPPSTLTTTVVTDDCSRKSSASSVSESECESSRKQSVESETQEKYPPFGTFSDEDASTAYNSRRSSATCLHASNVNSRRSSVSSVSVYSRRSSICSAVMTEEEEEEEEGERERAKGLERRDTAKMQDFLGEYKMGNNGDDRSSVVSEMSENNSVVSGTSTARMRDYLGEYKMGNDVNSDRSSVVSEMSENNSVVSGTSTARMRDYLGGYKMECVEGEDEEEEGSLEKRDRQHEQYSEEEEEGEEGEREDSEEEEGEMQSEGERERESEEEQQQQQQQQYVKQEEEEGPSPGNASPLSTTSTEQMQNQLVEWSWQYAEKTPQQSRTNSVAFSGSPNKRRFSRLSVDTSGRKRVSRVRKWVQDPSSPSSTGFGSINSGMSSSNDPSKPYGPGTTRRMSKEERERRIKELSQSSADESEEEEEEEEGEEEDDSDNDSDETVNLTPSNSLCCSPEDEFDSCPGSPGVYHANDRQNVNSLLDFISAHKKNREGESSTKKKKSGKKKKAKSDYSRPKNNGESAPDIAARVLRRKMKRKMVKLKRRVQSKMMRLREELADVRHVVSQSLYETKNHLAIRLKHVARKASDRDFEYASIQRKVIDQLGILDMYGPDYVREKLGSSVDVETKGRNNSGNGRRSARTPQLTPDNSFAKGPEEKGLFEGLQKKRKKKEKDGVLETKVEKYGVESLVDGGGRQRKEKGRGFLTNLFVFGGKKKGKKKVKESGGGVFRKKYVVMTEQVMSMSVLDRETRELKVMKRYCLQGSEVVVKRGHNIIEIKLEVPKKIVSFRILDTQLWKQWVDFLVLLQ